MKDRKTWQQRRADGEPYVTPWEALQLLFVGTLAACTPTAVTETVTNTKLSPTATKEVPKTPTVAAPEYAAGGPISQEQWKQIENSEYVRSQYEKWKEWTYYWSNARTRLFNPNTSPRFDIVVDPWNLPKDGNDKLEEKVAVMLRWYDDKNPPVEHISYFPRNTINPEEANSKFQLTPRDVKGIEGQYEIADWPGTGPLDISNAVWRGDDFYRLNHSGVINEAIDRNGYWSPVNFDTSMPEKIKQRMIKVEQLQNGAWEAYFRPSDGSVDMLMAIKPNKQQLSDGSVVWDYGYKQVPVDANMPQIDFISAANSLALPEGNGMWYRWGWNEEKKKFGLFFNADDNNDKPISEVEAVARLALRELKTGSGQGVYMVNEELFGAGMKIKPGMETAMHDQWLMSLFDSEILRDQNYWSSVGFIGTTFEEFKNWASTVGAIKLRLPGPLTYGKQAGVIDYGNTKVDSLGITFITPDDYQKNPVAKALADTLSFNTLGSYSSPNFDRFGLKNIDGQMHFIGVSRKLPVGVVVDFTNAQLGLYGVDNSVKVASFWWNQYLGIVRNTTSRRLGDLLFAEATSKLIRLPGLSYNNLDEVQYNSFRNLTYVCLPGRAGCGYLGGVYSTPSDMMTEDQTLFEPRL